MAARLFLYAVIMALITVPAAAGTLAKVKETGRFIIGFREDARPFAYLDKEGNPAGYSVDLCRHIADGIKQMMKLDDLKVEFVPVTSENRIDKVVSGDVDIECGSTTHTLSRRQRVDFTLSTFVTGAEMLLRSDEDIKNLQALAGHSVGVLSGTTTETGLRRTLKSQGIDAKVVVFDQHKDGVAALGEGKVDAYFADRILLIGLIPTLPNPDNFKLSGVFYSYEPYAFMIRRGDDNLRLAADSVLADLFRSGDVWEIYTKYFVDAQPSELLVALFLLEGLPVR